MSGRVGFFFLQEHTRIVNVTDRGANVIARKSRLLSKGIRIAIVDDHPSVREGLRMILDRESDFEVCGEAATVAEGLKMIGGETPDVAIVDISLGDENSLDMVRRLKSTKCTTRIVVWSAFDDLLYCERALSAGAVGYINKRQATSMIVKAIRKVMEGGVYVSEEMANHMMCRSVGGRPREELSPIATLSDRELEVFRMIGDGKTTVEISRALHLSVKTVETHRQRIKDKLQIEDAPKLIRAATQWVLENA
jgi:DNA-binding NarL/FixJ family response regulator